MKKKTQNTFKNRWELLFTLAIIMYKSKTSQTQWTTYEARPYSLLHDLSAHALHTKESLIKAKLSSDWDVGLGLGMGMGIQSQEMTV